MGYSPRCLRESDMTERTHTHTHTHTHGVTSLQMVSRSWRLLLVACGQEVKRGGQWGKPH